jgi:apolipoprotein N-acyltransferase
LSERLGEGFDLHALVPSGRQRVLLALTVVSALATLAAFPPISYPGLGWVAPIFFLLALSQVPPKQGFLLGWLYGTIFMASIVQFVLQYGTLPWVMLAVFMGLFYGLFGVMASLLRTAPPFYRVPAIAGAWALCEVFRGHFGSLALSFGDLAYSLQRPDDLPSIQIASLFGHYGVGFLMALLAAGFSCVLLVMLPMTWLRPPDFRRFNRDAGRMCVLCLLLVIGSYSWGRFTTSMGKPMMQAALTARPLRVSAVQAEGDGTQRRGSATVMADYAQYTVSQPADLIVWPETAIPYPLSYSRREREQIVALTQRMKAYMLVGAPEIVPSHTYNSAYFFHPDGTLEGSYRKMDLVIFGEYVPGRKAFPFLKHYPIRSFDFTAGAERKLFEAKGCRLAPLICFEGCFPDPTRELCRMGAELIVIITSDTWSRGSSEVQIHSPSAILRAIESRRFVVRAASVGQSAIYDPFGNRLAEVGPWQRGVAAATVAPMGGLTLYHRAGDWPLLIVSLVLLAIGLLRARRGSFIVPPS